MKKQISLFILGIFVSTAAHAGIMIEPFLGYGASTLNTEDTSGVPSAASPTGLGYGLRLGYKFMIPWVALDYKLTSGEQFTDTASQLKYDMNQTQMGVAVGADLPLGFRVFGGYGFDSKLKLKSSIDEVSLKGTYTKVGVGMSIIPMLKVNLEYIMNTYSKIADASGTDYDLSLFYKKFDNKMVFLSLSVPLNL